MGEVATHERMAQSREELEWLVLLRQLPQEERAALLHLARSLAGGIAR